MKCMNTVKMMKGVSYGWGCLVVMDYRNTTLAVKTEYYSETSYITFTFNPQRNVGLL